jgi:tetratricopeptide (TPR) repeat protein
MSGQATTFASTSSFARQRWVHRPSKERAKNGRVACVLVAVWFASAAHAGGITLSPEAAQALDEIYAGDSDAGIRIAHAIEQGQPESPLGYLLEGEAEWWKTYCAASGIKRGEFDAWNRAKEPEDDARFALADKAIALARARLAQSETAEMHVYTGLGFAHKARLYGLREERRNIARAGVAGRSEFLRALELDPDMADATAGVGLYNYHVDALSTFAKILRVVMRIPGGSKQEGIRQMAIGAERGVFFAVDARFYLATNLRTFDERFEDALSFTQPLIARYPRNAIFLLLAGNLNLELGRNAEAAEYFNAALDSTDSDPNCAARVRELANSFLASRD